MTTNTWVPFFGFAALPFSKEIADDDLWVPPSRERRVDRLVEACHEHEHMLLTGEPGVGKTCVLRSLRQRLPEAGFRLTYCHNATLGRRDFYRQLCLSLGLSPRATAAAVFYEISQHIHELGAARVHPVFLLDEARLLHQDVLDHLHILANYGWDSRALLTIVLVGLPELEVPDMVKSSWVYKQLTKPRRHRGRHLLAQAGLRAAALQLEFVRLVQGLHLGLGGLHEPPDHRPRHTPVGISLSRLANAWRTERSRWGPASARKGI